MKTNKAEFIARVAYIVGKYNFGYSLDENPKTNQLNFLSVDNEEHYCGFYINMKKVEFWINDEKETRYIYPEENGKFNIEVQSADRCNLNNLYLKTPRG